MNPPLPSGNTSRDAPSDPLVSVIIPIYNRAHLIGAAVDSALAQTYQELEVIVVDDGSTDGLQTMLAAISDPRVHVVVHPRNRGAAAARNSGIAAARGEFLAFLDSDDTWRTDKLAHQMAAMRGQPPEVAGHVCGYECLKVGYRARDILPDWTAQTFSRSQLLGCTCGPGTTLLCRRAVFDAVGPLDEELRRLEDWDWLLRLAAKGYRLLASPIVLARVEIATRPSGRDIEVAVQRIRERHRESVRQQGRGAYRIFEATLLLERASAAFADKAYARATAYAVRSLIRFPLRDSALYGRLIERGLRHFATAATADRRS